MPSTSLITYLLLLLSLTLGLSPVQANMFESNKCSEMSLSADSLSEALGEPCADASDEASCCLSPQAALLSQTLSIDNKADLIPRVSPIKLALTRPSYPHERPPQ